MFEEGKGDSPQKMSPGEMRECLLQNFPNYFSFPGDTKIKQFIGAQFQMASIVARKNRYLTRRQREEAWT